MFWGKKKRADVEMPVLGMCSVSLPVLKHAEEDRVSHGKSWKMEQNSKKSLLMVTAGP